MMNETISFIGLEAFILALGSLGLGMVLLIRGGNWTIDAAIFVARRIGVSPILVGFTIVAFGTSLPELIVSINANMNGLPGIAIGNVLGSNIANILFVIGTTAIITKIVADPKEFRFDLMTMMLATCFLAGLMLYGVITQLVGVLMLVALVALTFWQYRKAIKSDAPIPPEVDEAEDVFKSLKPAIFFLIIGLVFIALGAEFLVRGAKVTAGIIGVPDAVIGLSIIAIGTSLPELSTCLIAAARKQTGLILGNIIGSNFFNIMMIIGATAAFKTINMADSAPQLVTIDIWVTLAISLIFTLILLFYKKIGRKMGIVFLASYVFYIVAIFGLYLMDKG
jgi:cation:H+ antiporter